MEVTPERSDTARSSSSDEKEPTKATNLADEALFNESDGEGESDADKAAAVDEPCSNIRKRKKPPVVYDESGNDDDEKVEETSDQGLQDDSIPMGFKIRKEFDDGNYYEGTVISGPESVEGDELCWRIRYEDGDEEDLFREEVLNWAVDTVEKAPSDGESDETANDQTTETETTMAEKLKPTRNYKSHVADYETAKKDLCYRMGVTEEEVVAALDQLTPPYGLNAAMQLIHKAKDNPDSYKAEREKFIPRVGLRVRKNYLGSTYYGNVTKEAEWLEVDGERVQMWEVTFDDGDIEDMDFNELMLCDANRPTRTHPVRGRQLCALELFSGCGMVTQEFANRRWRVRSIDNSPTSYATDKVDIMKIKYQDIGMVPDFIWASPPCFTYSNMAAGKHRSPDKGEFEKTPEARENNRFLAQLAFLIRWARSLNPHLIVVIENPVGALQKMPLMKEMVNSFGLHSVIVDYCAFGRDDKKPTFLWTNDFKLRSTLSEFRCGEKCPYAGGFHPIGARKHGRMYNAASIPQALAEEVADHVHSTFYERRVRHIKQATLTEEEEEAFNRALASG